ncbi:hypothetical protein BDV95DRAFT_383006 [Massariosphaeria phaeospora]|uniref:GPI anchored protein n=1 Tax=Massariosphaeria phaeospora TaxID=100035 RepID=A0A7C8I751_9PLEO|nr:hypothetical protein BDV95DRAFT_383006 [Massariosphaeria phaeospora]
MYLPSSLLALPATVIAFLYAAPIAAEPPWPHNLPRHLKYFPEDEVHVKRGLNVQERLQKEKPIGVKKMGLDEGEMFFLDDWIFASDSEKKGLDSNELANITEQAISPLRPHSDKALLESILRFRVRDALLKRDFRCPEGTNDCSSIGARDSCCGTSETCISIEDTGYGSVGCCPQGRACAGAIRCDEARGYTSCPDSPNGGCCLPGYTCQDTGCVVAGTSVTFVQPSTSAEPPRPTSTAVVIVPTTPTPSPTPSPTTSYTCSTGWFSCPASLGGGCCQEGLECATGATCTGGDSTSQSSVAPSAPVRPTSNTPEQPATSDSLPSLCPTGFYVCSAYYPSGCCRVGSDCQTTGSCIPTASQTIVNSNGVTIAAPTGAGLATPAPPQGGSCPSNWYSCAANLGGNCCPNGFSCGEQCTATSGTEVSGKVAPSTATFVSATAIWGIVTAAAAIGVAMVLL